MADAVELKQMVMSFRVAELQVLLGFAGRNKTGRKQDLLARSLQLIQRGCSTPVQIKIRELYRRVTAPNPNNITPPTNPAPSSNRYIQPGFKSSGHSSMTASGDGKTRGGEEYSGGVNKLALPQMPHSSYPVLPDVKFKRLPFYDVLGELLKTCTLVPKNASRFQEQYSVFHLTPTQAQDIALSRDLRPGSKCEYTVQVQLRFCLMETSCEQEDNFPPSICVRVNGKMAQLPNPIPTNKPGVEPKRPSRSVNITSYCRISPTVSNHLNVSWAQDLGRNYCVGVFLVRKLAADTLLDRLKQNGMKHPDHSRALIKEKLRHDPDSEIATTSLKVSLTCPLGKMRIRTPCRSHTCSHLQCFDAATFLMMNEKKPTWLCPVCDKMANFANLFIDGLYTEICRQCPPDCNEIEFDDDGNWKSLKQVKEQHVIASPAVVKLKEEPVESKPQVPKKPQPHVIDLTLDSSDEEDEDDDDDDDMEGPPAQRPRRESAGSPRTAAGQPPIVNVVSDSSECGSSDNSSSGATSPVGEPRKTPSPLPNTASTGATTEKFDLLENSIRTSLNAIKSSASSLQSSMGTNSGSGSSIRSESLAYPQSVSESTPPFSSLYDPANLDLFSMLQSDFDNSNPARLPSLPVPPSFDTYLSGMSTPPTMTASSSTNTSRPATTTPPHPSMMMSGSSPDVISLD